VKTWPVSDVKTAIAAFREHVLWATDRLGLVRTSRHELGWGCWVLTFASHGRAALVVTDGDDQSRAALAALEADLVQYIEDFGPDVTAELESQFRAVKEQLQRTLAAKQLLSEIHQLESLADDRDTIQFFLRGAARFVPGRDFATELKTIDEPLEQFVKTVVVRAIADELSEAVVRELEVPAAPADFWWRHLVDSHRRR
jgi:hypothetical protein